jgi:LacI family transcriptional regulator
VPATIQDVARASGVHISTVSRAFSMPHLVNAATRSKVIAAAEALGYRPNRAARALITGRTHNIGLIVADIANPFFPPLIKAAESQARQRDYHVFVADTDEDPVVEEDLVQTLAKQVDGILLCSPRMANRQIERLRSVVPLVVVNRRVEGVPAVLMDIGHGARTALAHLIGLGHRRVALLAGPRGSWTNREIRRCVAAAAKASGVELTIFGPNPPNEEAGVAAADRVARAGVTAVIAYNDLMALGLIEGLGRLGVDVPGELSVVGIDDIAPGRFSTPKLTTVATPTAAAGRHAVDMLLQHGGSGEAPARGEVILDVSLVVRESTAPAAAPARNGRPPAPATA